MATHPENHPIFHGVFRHGIDDKNRITIPAAWREKDSDDFFLMPHQKHGCLVVMPPNVFREFGEKAATHLTPERLVIFKRQFYADALKVATDKQGRLLLPVEYCKNVGLRKDAVLAGCSERFEIWSPANWKTFRVAEKNNYAEVATLVGL